MIEPIVRESLGGEDKLSNANFAGKLLSDTSGLKTTFEDCDFSAAIITRGYFRDATFKKCTFVGCRITDSNFRGARFIQCKFEYCSFNRCVLPIKELISNLPSWPNVRRELIQNMRANVRSVGDFESDQVLLRQELEAERAHWAKAKEQNESYYIEHYGSTRQQIGSHIKSMQLAVDAWLWGHGFSFLRLSIWTCLMLLALSTWLFIDSSLWTTQSTVSNTWIGLKQSSMTTLSLYIDLPDVEPKIVREHWWFSVIVVMLRYVSLGLFVTCFYRRLARN